MFCGLNKLWGRETDIFSVVSVEKQNYNDFSINFQKLEEVKGIPEVHEIHPLGTMNAPLLLYYYTTNPSLSMLIYLML